MTDRTKTLKQEFAQNSCPPDLPIYDSGIDAKARKMPLADAIKVAARHSDILMFGDTDHYNSEIHGQITHPDILKSLKESGFTDIAIEVSKKMQHWNDKLVSGQLDSQQFTKSIHRALAVSQGNEDGTWTHQITDTAMFAKDKSNGIKLHFADPNNGEHWCSNDLNAEERKACEIENLKDRYFDQQLVADHNQRLKEPTEDGRPRKILQVYGASHFSIKNGTRDGLEGRAVKMDVYANRSDYESSKDVYKSDNEDGVNTNEIKPDLIYMLDTQTLYTTCATSPDLIKDLDNSAQNPQHPAPEARHSRPLPKKVEMQGLSR